MPLFLGYDPGGEGKNGVAVLRIADDGTTFERPPETRTLCDVEEVCRWLRAHDKAEALGIDTPLAWSRKGDRACDDALRRKYPEQSESVIAQDRLRGAMTISGVIIARLGYHLGLPLLVESHPKLVLRAWLEDHMAGTEFAKWHEPLCRKKTGDHEADALIAAWCASRWYFEHWTVNLYDAFAEQGKLVFPAREAVYPWPESISAA